MFYFINYIVKEISLSLVVHLVNLFRIVTSSVIHHIGNVYLFIYICDEMGRACSTNWVKRNAYRTLVESQEERDQ
jgi:hypothetical protein